MTNANIYWLRDVPTGRIAVMPRPRGGKWLADEVSGWHCAGLRTVVSLLERHEVKKLGLRDEPAFCEAVRIEFISFPIPDGGVPLSICNSVRLVAKLASKVSSGTAVGIHCRAGIGRSALLAGCILSRLGVPEMEVFPCISRARGVSCPETEAQVKWFASFLRAEEATGTGSV